MTTYRTTYRLHISTDNGFHKAMVLRTKTINEAIELARQETAIRIDAHNADNACFCIDRKRDSFHICSEIVEGNQG